MNNLLVYLVSGLALAGSFALIGSGIVVVYRVTHVLNFAQGTFAVFGAFFSYSLSSMLPGGLGGVVSVVACALVGLVVGVAAVGKRGTPPMISLVPMVRLSAVAVSPGFTTSEGIVAIASGNTPVIAEPRPKAR